MLNPGLLAAIPAPPGNNLSIGPLTFNYYGLMIALGVLAAVEIGRRRWTAKDGDPDDITAIATWAVPAGLLGARLYHVVTEWKTYFSSEGALSPIDALKIWNGGLAIYGGLIAGVVAGVWQAQRRGITGGRLWDAIDAIIPGIPVAQAIGRVGNWFNQENFGGPSDAPWALKVDPQYRPLEFADSATFHPAFLYEGVLNLILAGILLWLDAKKKVRRGLILPIWIIGYGVIRLLLELIRTDRAAMVLGLRINLWTSLIAIALGAVVLFLMLRRPTPTEVPITSFEDLAAVTDTDDDDDATSPDAKVEAVTDEVEVDNDAAAPYSDPPKAAEEQT